MISCTFRRVASNAGLTKHKRGTVIPRRRPLWCVPGLAGVVLVGVATAADGQSSSVYTAATTLDKENGCVDRVIRGDGLWTEPPVLLSPDVPVHRVTVIGGPRGGTVISGKFSRLGTTCEGDPGAGYCNALGSYMFGPSGVLASARIADDIALARVAGCILDRYVIRVTGDRNGDGSGAALGAYTVNFGLYEACPGAGGNPIQDTAGQITVPAEEASIIKEIVFYPPDQVALPPNLYLGVSFSRDLCGTVVGAPATLGFSVDRFDFPGFHCAAWFGGFPGAPHASFYAEIYVESDCPDAFVGYKNTNHAGIPYSAGVQGRFADDVRLGVIECNMVAYEIAHKGDGIIGVDLRSFLSNTDPDHGGLIPGTTLYCFSYGNDVQVCRKEFEAPIPLPLSAFYVTYETSSALTGPLQTCKKANPGGTANFFMVYAADEWRPQEFDTGCWGGFELTIFCEDTPPTGACCDMILTDQDGEAVCRDNLPLMNCANPVPLLWQEDQECASTCIGGDNAGEPCTRQADCPEGICPGPFNHPCGVAACCKPNGGCQNLTENECYALEPVDAPRVYQREQFCNQGGQRCPIPACLDREGECTLPREAFCVAGDRHGLECYPWAVPTECPGQTCLGGPHDGESCDPDNECPDQGPDIGRCVDFVCDGGSNHGNPCDPNVECLPGGECTQGQCVGDVGCENPYCCTSVCEQPGFAYCCLHWWDELCAAETFRVCELPPSNDNCYSPDPRDGALLLDIPSFAESDGIHATVEEGEPGFCCNIGHESDPSLGAGSRGFGTVWYKFVAPPNGECDGGDRDGQWCDPNAADPENPVNGCPGGTCLWLPVSVGLDTCCSVSRGGTVEDPGGMVRDTLLQVFALPEPDRGLCGDDVTVCSVSDQDCPDGSSCEFDEAYACSTLIPIACSDDEETCSCQGIPQPTRSKACARDLVPGETYYVMVGAKTNRLNEDLDAYIDLGVYRLRVWTPCGGTRLMDNDLCMNAELLAGEYVGVPFDISGEAFDRAPATFDCPGPPVTCFDAVETMQNDVWYEWTAPYNAEATFQTCGFDENGDPSDDLTPDTAMVVYDGCDCPVQIGTELGCSDFQPTPCFLGSKVTIDVNAGRCYKVRLGGRLGRTHDDSGDPIAGELRIEVTSRDCNDNGIPDSEDIAAGTSQDCQPNSVPDECEVPPIGTGPDCNSNLTPDVCEVPPIGPPENDCNNNSIPDDCEPDEDCNNNGVQDICDIAGGTSEDCNGNLTPDVCEVPPIGPPENDCNDNSIPDDCEPDEDCNDNGVQDICDLAGGTSADCNSNGVLDECEVPPIGTGPDCNDNLTPDVCEVPPIGPPENDCNGNSIPDDCEAVMPSIVQHPAPDYRIACVGDVATFTVVADGWEPLSYQWRRDFIDLEDGENITGATSAMLTIDPVDLNDAGRYDVVVSNVCGTVNSGDALLDTFTCPPEGPKFSVVAVRINGTCLDSGNSAEHCTRDIDCDSGVCGGGIAPVDTVLVRPGDKIQCEILASDWSWDGQQLSTYQADIDTDKFQAEPPVQGELRPFEGPRPCQNDLECADHSVTCMNGFCDTSDDRAGGAFIRLGRTDYVFFDLRQFPVVDLHQYRFASTLVDSFDGPAYSPPPKYCGTLIVAASEDAAGVFTLDLIDYGWSTMQDELRRFILPLETEPLTIRVWQPPKPAPRQPPTER